ncbi:MAG: HAMP domain-containing protein [Chlamydiae bacterium]|nr:HAMP domain-containing protein [Chlamydiota bacterium]MBI3267004.1 HAMP domain-containing protein [Chlamydiota bacterium]
MDLFFYKSVRFKIILLCLLTLMGIFFVFSIFIQTQFSHSLYEKTDALIMTKAEGIENAIQTYWQTQKMDLTRDWFSSHVFPKGKDMKFEKIADYLTTEKLRDELEINAMSVDILNPKGELIASSREIPEVDALRRKLFEKTSPETRFDNLNVSSKGGNDLPIRVLTKTIKSQNRVQYIVQIVASLSPVMSEMKRLRKIFFMLLPIAILIAGVTAFSLVKVTLRPIDEMVSRIGEIKPDNLGVRIHIHHSDDEVGRLAQTFNEMLERLEKSFLSQHQMIEDISHELKTPITIMKGQLQLALNRLRSSREYKSVLYSNLEEVEKIRNIVDEVLTLARLDSQEFSAEMEEIDLNSLLNLVLEDIRVLAESKNVELSLQLRPKTILRGNETQLRRLFFNLLENAVKYNHPGGKITVRIKTQGQDVQVEVSDSGVGIPEEDLPYIFDRFYQAHKARENHDGIGLGLSIAKSIVQAHKGDIQVKSHLGQGTTFQIYFPMFSSYVHK